MKLLSFFRTEGMDGGWLVQPPGNDGLARSGLLLAKMELDMAFMYQNI